MSKTDSISLKGEIIAFNGDSRYTVNLETGNTIKAVLSGKLKLNKIKIIPGDKVEVEFSPYDLTHGRICYRYKE